MISHKIRPVLIEENASLAVDLGFYEPLGYVIDRNNTKFETFKVTIHYLFNGNEKQQSQSLSGEWKIGEKAIFTFPLEKELSGDIDVRIEVLATLSSDRPYQYRDNICMDFTETVKINRSSGVSQKESVISSINASNYYNSVLDNIVHCELVACGWMIETLPPTCCLSKCFLRRLRITINRKEKGA